jgi:hypothetical protein
MNLRIKALGLGLLAVMATSAFAAMNAGASIGGHLTNDALNGHVLVTGTASTGSTHGLMFVKEGSNPEAENSCHMASYTGTINAATVQSVTITPEWNNCTTGTTGAGDPFPVHENGCVLTFTSGKTEQTHHTAAVVCPAGKAIEITHLNCTIKIAPQTLGGGGSKGGIVYTTTVENNKHALTLDLTVKEITAHYEAGICVFLGTTQKSEVKGSITVRATSTESNVVNITETTG